MRVIAQNRLMNAIMLNRLIILFASLGMVISALLWISHSADFALPCTGGGCDEVARSPYSRIAGIPVAAFGFGYFGLCWLLLALSRLQYPEQWRTYGKMLTALSTLGVLGVRLLYLCAAFRAESVREGRRRAGGAWQRRARIWSCGCWR
jgi:uncharacterized membrane protein